MQELFLNQSTTLRFVSDSAACVLSPEEPLCTTNWPLVLERYHLAPLSSYFRDYESMLRPLLFSYCIVVFIRFFLLLSFSSNSVVGPDWKPLQRSNAKSHTMCLLMIVRCFRDPFGPPSRRNVEVRNMSLPCLAISLKLTGLNSFRSPVWATFALDRLHRPLGHRGQKILQT